MRKIFAFAQEVKIHATLGKRDRIFLLEVGKSIVLMAIVTDIGSIQLSLSSFCYVLEKDLLYYLIDVYRIVVYKTT